MVISENAFSIQCKAVELSEAGTRIFIDIFAPTVEDFLAHLRFQLSIIKKKSVQGPEFMLSLPHPPSFQDSVLKMIQYELGVNENDLFSGGKTGIKRPMASVFICESI